MILDSNSASGGYEIDNSLKFESDNSERISFTPSSAIASERRKHTISFWIKRTELGSTQYIYEWGGSEGDYLRNFLRFQSDDKLRFATSYNVIIDSDRFFRDTSAWYHIVIQTDTASANSDSDTKFWMYINGELEKSSASFNANDTMAFANNSQHDIGYTSVDNGAYGNFYLAEFHAVGGLKVAPTEFAETDDDSGIWKPKEYTGSYGTNGFYLDFEDSSSLGADDSGNGNNFTLNNIAAADQATDTPTNNFNIFTPRYNYGSSYSARITEGGTKIAHPHASWSGAKGNYGLINGKWYWEFTTMGNLQNVGFGIQSTTTSTSLYNHHAIQNNNTIFIGYSTLNYYYWTGGSQTSNESTGWVSGFTVGAGDVYGFALDLDSSTKKFFLYRNGTLLNGASGTNLPTPMQDEYVSTFIGAYNGDGTRWNFGGYTSATVSSGNSDANGYGNFEYSVPSGYYAICSKNVAEYA